MLESQSKIKYYVMKSNIFPGVRKTRYQEGTGEQADTQGDGSFLSKENRHKRTVENHGRFLN